MQHEGDHAEALALALEAADAAVGWGDAGEALRWLEVAEKLNTALPLAYAAKRRALREAHAGRAQG